MGKQSQTLIILLLLAPLQLCAEDCTNIPRIPYFLGKGYDIVYGNPSDASVDPGFRYEVIVFDYKEGITTQDRKFLVPDGISFQKTQSCTFASTVNEFRGTQSYQNDLKISAKIGGGYDGEGLKAAFTASAGFKNMQQKIEKQDTVIFQASSKCQSYKLTLDIFKSYRVSSSFFQALDSALKFNDWSAFISQYGTHYATEVVFGGRAIQEYEFSRTSVAVLNEKGFDISRSVKVGIAGFFAENSQDLSVSFQQKSEVDSIKKKVTTYFVGGAMPKQLNIVNWQRKVIEQPMPISYNLMPLSDLFVFSPSKSPEWVNNAKQSFYKALNGYCTGKCSLPSPDKPVLKLKQTPFAYTSYLYGGDGGYFYQWNQFTPNWHIYRVRIRSAVEIDGIQVYATHKSKPSLSSESSYYGGSGGSESYFTIDRDDWINKIQLRSGTRIDSLAFYSKNGRSQRFGGNGGNFFVVMPPTQDYRWTGIVGKSAARLDKIGFLFTLTIREFNHNHHITKVIYPELQEEEE